MDTTTLFKSALKYPLSDYRKLLIIGVISLLSQINKIYSSFGGTNEIISSILSIVSIVFGLILAGYFTSIIKDSIENKDEIPDFDWKPNFIMGIKYTVLNVFYLIIPTIILLIVGWATGLFDAVYELVSNMNIDLLTAATNATALSNSIGMQNAALNSLAESFMITLMVGIILSIIFGLLFLIGTCRLSDTCRFISGANMKECCKDISSIGLGNYIIWAIVFAIIILILTIIFGIISQIPYIGTIMGTLIISPFIILFMGKSLGLIYANK